MSKKQTQNQSKSRRVSAGELELLEILWQKGEVTLSETHQAMGPGIGYTTVQTRLNRLAEKGLAKRSEGRPAKYSAAVNQDEIHAGQFDLLLKRIGSGSVVPLVAHLVEDRSLSRAEIDQLRSLINQAEEKLS